RTENREPGCPPGEPRTENREPGCPPGEPRTANGVIEWRRNEEDHMKVLVVGGSGYVGGLGLPALAQQHTVRIFDLRPPATPGWEYIAGAAGDLDALVRAAAGVDALLYMAMGEKKYDTPSAITTNLDANVKGVYLALYAAHQTGVTHAV